MGKGGVLYNRDIMAEHRQLRSVSGKEKTMEFKLIRKADKNMIYYGVYHTAAELADEGDVLCSVRKKYFETGMRQKNRSTFNIMGEMIRTSYTMESGRPLKWKKLIGSRLSERVTIRDNSYIIESLDSERKVYKRSVFDFKHKWLTSEYYLSGDSNSPDFTYIPTEEDDCPAVMVKKSGKDIDILYPFETSVDKEMTEKLNETVGEPPLLCKTSCGTFYFCTREEADIRNKALERLLLENVEPEDDDELIESGFEINVDGLNEDESSVAESPVIMHEIIPGLPEEVLTTNDDTITEENMNNDINSASDNIIQENDNIPDDVPEEKSSEPSENNIKPDEISDTKEEDKEEQTPPVPNPLSEHKSEPVIRDFSFTADVHQLYEESNTGEEAGFNTTEGPACAFYGQCPYENIDKLIIESGGKQYFYFGETEGDIRHGSGRTAMFDGKTAYEGGYKNDKRDGFGIYYFKSGKLCYVGSWKENKRHGLGTAYSSGDGSVFIGKWSENEPVSVGASFDRDGKLIYVGKTKDGKRSGTGITYSEENDLFFVGKYRDGEFLGEGTQFDSDGNMLYAGGFSEGMRQGVGVSYYPDGSVQYKGNWEQGEYCGEGTLYLPDGCTLRGCFSSGRANGECTLTDKNGRLIYQGGFRDDLYHGSGRLCYSSGKYIEGRFTEGETTGIINEYSSDGQLIYCGEWADMERSGKGIAYIDGEKHYEGEFLHGDYDGNGKLYRDGSVIYSGQFRNGKINGFGTQIDNGVPVYSGMWEDDLYSGCGILYENGKAVFAGCFKEGMREGRINEIADGRISRKCLFEKDKLVYMCEYSENGSILYYGNVKDGQYSGMGCSFNDSCEKVFEGIFKNGKPDKSMSVFYKELEDLPECKELEQTEYNSFIHAPGYAVELAYCGGIYTGQVKDDKPQGLGTILYFDHRYTGMFRDGEPLGKGVIYMRDGSEINGEFVSSPSPSCETLIFTNLTYYRINNSSELTAQSSEHEDSNSVS